MYIDIYICELFCNIIYNNNFLKNYKFFLTIAISNRPLNIASSLNLEIKFARIFLKIRTLISLIVI